jgi:hypothetical protein
VEEVYGPALHQTVAIITLAPELNHAMQVGQKVYGPALHQTIAIITLAPELNHAMQVGV